MLTKTNNLIFNSIILIITITVLNTVFELNVGSIENILRIQLHAPQDSLEFHYRQKYL